MKTHGKFALPVLLTTAALTLGACGGPEAGAGGQGQGGDGMQGMEGMDHDNNNANNNGGNGGGQQAGQETTAAPAAGESTGMGMGETTGGTTGMEGMQGMEGMNHGQTGAGGMAAMSREMVMENGEYSDRAFIDSMVPHHQGAVDMAEVALENAQHEELRSLAEEIVGAQEAEIEDLRGIKREEFGTSEIPSDMSQEEMDAMGMTDPAQLAGERPFDRAFIDAMTSHHRSAIAMAKVALEESDNPQVKGIAQDIVDAQRRELAQMERWREQWYPQG